ncbi:MAG: hypothetical protein FJ272_08355, partial [Planctomycetes bacterium]|nr:hypothetical protein [Planctomycetota bacterium]
MCTRHAPWLGLWLLALSWTALADEAKVVEELVVYSKGAAQGFRFRAWNMKQAERDGRIHLNEDWKGEPWAGISFTPTEKDKPVLVLTPDWIKFGFARFRINGLADAYGSVGAPCTFQFLFQGAAKRYEHIPNHFYEGGKGIDADARTWQELWIPLALFDLKPGEKVTGLNLQCVLKPTRAFALESLSLVRFSGPREADRAKAESVVAQPWVTWPEYDELPEALKADRNPPLYRDEKFVTADGRRAFLISTWGREDQRQDLGYSRDGKVVAHYDLYDPKTQGFIYEQPLNGKSLSRLGFNCFANQVNPVPFWDAIGYKAKETPSGFTEEAFREYVRAMHAPFFVDMVCFPWTLGRPALDKDTNLPPDMLHDGREHWTPYRIIGKGREAWLTMWRTYAQRYKDAGANVIFYELMNEPAYLATTPDHRAEFVDWLKRRYGTLDKVNETWGTKHGSWDEVKGFKKLNDSPGVFFDYDEYLGDRFTDLVAEG